MPGRKSNRERESIINPEENAITQANPKATNNKQERDPDKTIREISPQKKKKAFVLMPSGNHEEYEGGAEESEFVYNGIIVPALNEAYNKQVDILREVDNRNPGAITRDLVMHIAESDICIVDVTGLNPNVFFELGMRYSLRRTTTILLKQPKTVIPFDIANYRSVEYSPKYHGIKRAIASLVETFKHISERRPITSDSLVFEVFPKMIVRIPGVIDQAEEITISDRQMAWSEYWERLQYVISNLRDLFRNGRYVPDIILGITNGGLIVADLLGRDLFTGTPILSLWADRISKDTFFFKNPINDAVFSGIKNTVLRSKKDVQVLLVDDIVASGTTIKQALLYLKEQLPNAHVYFLPLFSRNQKYIDRDKDLKASILWTSPLFNFSDDELRTMFSVDRYVLPYGKELRSS